MWIRGLFALALMAVLATVASFGIHLATAAWLPGWLADRMVGVEMLASWDVRYLAGATSIEYVLGSMLMYTLMRRPLLGWRPWARIVVFTLLILSTRGLLMRQPLMDWAIGNPIDVVVIQNGLKALVWIVVASLSAIGVEWFYRIYKAPEE